MKQPRLKNKQLIPHGGGFRITDPATGITSYGLQFQPLLNKIETARKANGIPIGLEFEQEIERLCCESYPDECVEVDPSMPVIRSLSLSDIIRGTQVLVALKLSGGKLVDRKEAERRGEICSRCRFNVKFAKPCSGMCPELDALVRQIVGNQGMHWDQFLHSCSICGCLNSAQCWVPLDVLAKGVTPNMKAQFSNVPECWKQVGDN